MKLQILGSAAAEGWPALFCECELCQKAWKFKGKDVRRRTAYLVNDDLLIDFGPDVYWQSVEFGIDLSKLDAILLTHSHEDHCNPVEFFWRRKGFSAISRNLGLYGDQMALAKLERAFGSAPWERHLLTPHLVLPGHPFKVKDYTVMPILADHASMAELPVNYIIQDAAGKTLLIGNDSGWWCEKSWDILKNYKLDIAVLEGTMGSKYTTVRRNHLGFQATVEVKDALFRQGSIDSATTVVVNHFSHNGGSDHAAMEAFFNPNGIEVGYDGKVIER